VGVLKEEIRELEDKLNHLKEKLQEIRGYL
jgi:hypothetical protein